MTPPLANARLGRDAELVGEDGELVGPAVAVGVFADDDPVAALALAAAARWDSRPCSATQSRPRSSQVMQIGLPPISGSAANSFSSKPSGVTDVLHRLGRRRAASASSLIGSPVVPHCRSAGRSGTLASTYSNGLTSLRDLASSSGASTKAGTTAGSLPDGPADAALDEVLEAGVAPGPLVVAPGGVEDAALALRAHPGPRLLAVAFRRGTRGRCGPSRCAWCGRRSRPSSRSRSKPFMIGWSASAIVVSERARAVPLELGADQLDVLRRVEEAVRGAVQRDEALAAVDVVEQRLLLLRRDLGRCWRR